LFSTYPYRREKEYVYRHGQNFIQSKGHSPQVNKNFKSYFLPKMHHAKNRIQTQKFPLYGIERYFSLTNDATTKSAHVMTIESDDAEGIDIILQRLPQAVQTVWNRHPRMRAVEALDEVNMAALQPKLTLKEANELVTIIPLTEKQFKNDSRWHAYVAEECARPMDRHRDLPYFVHVLSSRKAVRLILFSDHFMSDGHSCMLILNSLLEEVCTKNGVTCKEEKEDKEEIVPPSLFERWLLTPMGWKTWLLRKFLYYFGDHITRQTYSQRHYALPTAKEVQDFSFTTMNSSPNKALFASGTSDNLKKLCIRCKEEGVTVGGAMYAAVAIAYLKAKYPKGIQNPDDVKSIHIITDVTYNMRDRVENPLPSDIVGAYIASRQLKSLEREGIALNAGFWDIARRCKKEILEGVIAPDLVTSSLYINDRFHRGCFDPKLIVPHSLLCDVNISNAGRYPYAKSFSLWTDGNLKKHFVIKVVAYHRYSSLPWLSAGSFLYTTSVDYMCYGASHRYEDEVGKILFDTFVETVESMGSIPTDATIYQVFEKKIALEA
jgi:hypothetical protein